MNMWNQTPTAYKQNSYDTYIVGDGHLAQAYVLGKKPSHLRGIPLINDALSRVFIVGKGKHRKFFEDLRLPYILKKEVHELSGSVVLAVRPDNAPDTFQFIKSVGGAKIELLTSIISGLNREDVASTTTIPIQNVSIATMNTNIKERSGILWHDTPLKKNIIFSQTFGRLTSNGYIKKMPYENILDGIVLFGSGNAMHAKKIQLEYEMMDGNMSLEAFLNNLRTGKFSQSTRDYLKTTALATENVFGHSKYNNYVGRIFQSTVRALVSAKATESSHIDNHIAGIVTQKGCTATVMDQLNPDSITSTIKLSYFYDTIRQKSLTFRDIALT